MVHFLIIQHLGEHTGLTHVLHKLMMSGLLQLRFARNRAYSQKGKGVRVMCMGSGTAFAAKLLPLKRAVSDKLLMSLFNVAC